MPQKKGRPAAPPETNATATAPEVPDHLLQEIDTDKPDTAAPAVKPAKKSRAKAPKKADQPADSPDETADEAPAVESTKTATLDDEATEQAVNDIAADEADVMLTLQDVANEVEDEAQPKSSVDWLVLVIVLLILLATIFFTRQDLVTFYQSLNS